MVLASKKQVPSPVLNGGKLRFQRGKLYRIFTPARFSRFLFAINLSIQPSRPGG